MIIQLDDAQARATLGAMRAIGHAHHGALTDFDRRTVDAAGHLLLGRPELSVDTIADATPEELAATVPDEDQARLSVRMLAVMSLVDGALDAEKTARVQAYADALGVDESYLNILADAAADEIATATACIVRKNAESFPGLDVSLLDVDATAPFLPYRDGNEEPELEARYQALGGLPEGTFGRAFFAHFDSHGFAFPGNPNGLAEAFTTPHDTSHVLSGYSTTQLGELCVSTFIGAMHPDHPMAAEVLPVLFSWHLGIKLNEIAQSSTGFFDPEKFWTAWRRGTAVTVDVVAAGWDFWGATEQPLDELRRAYGVPPVEPALLA